MLLFSDDLTRWCHHITISSKSIALDYMRIYVNAKYTYRYQPHTFKNISTQLSYAGGSLMQYNVDT